MVPQVFKQCVKQFVLRTDCSFFRDALCKGNGCAGGHFGEVSRNAENVSRAVACIINRDKPTPREAGW